MTLRNLCAGAALACGFAYAADWTPMDVKTGQWETVTTQQVSGLPPIPQSVLDKMNPEQRAQMQAALQAQNGKSTTHRYCLKKEDLSKPLFDDSDRKNCKETLVAATATKREIRLECEESQGKVNGTIRIEAAGPDNAKITSQVTMSNGRGSMNANATTTAKWVGAVCTGKED